MPNDQGHHHLNLAEDAELLAGAGATIYGADHLLKATDPEEDSKSHLFKAGIAAIVAIGAYELLRRAEASGDPNPFAHSGSRSRSFSPDDRSRERSNSHQRGRSVETRHHKAHLAEQVIGAYALGKELLGDKRHHVGHLVAEAIGGAGLIQELRGRDRIEEEERRARSRSRR